jgi:hypothetical protein
MLEAAAPLPSAKPSALPAAHFSTVTPTLAAVGVAAAGGPADADGTEAAGVNAGAAWCSLCSSVSIA